MESVSEREVSIVGGGLVGSLLAIFLARRGFSVAIHERRPDPRVGASDGGRSINLVVTERGLHALRRVGLERAVLELTVPVLGRMMHAVDGGLSYQPYGKDDSERNHSVPRGELNHFLLTEAERRGVRLCFSRALVAADLESGRLRFRDVADDSESEVEASVIFAADGAGSVVRGEMMRLEGREESTELLEHGYKELEIPAAVDGGFRMQPDALHIWPRGDLMLMALPNLDGSFTVTLYLPHAGPAGFADLDRPEKVRDLFERHFPDAVPLIPDLERDFCANPTGVLGTVRCRPWNVGGRALLIGDAAHAIVPFFGQGMNSGFEDCTVLDRLVDERGPDWSSVFDEFSRARKPDAEAIADMALDNFVEMRDRVGDAAFLLRKSVEHRLEQEFPLVYRSRYSMVVYGTMPYHVAQEAGRIQNEILDELCRGLECAEELDLDRALDLVRARLTPYLDSRGVSLSY